MVLVCRLRHLKNKKAQTSVIRFTGLPQPTIYYEEIHAMRESQCRLILLLLGFFEVVVREAIEQIKCHVSCETRGKDMTKFPFCTFFGGKSSQKRLFFTSAGDKMLIVDGFGTTLAVGFANNHTYICISYDTHNNCRA